MIKHHIKYSTETKKRASKQVIAVLIRKRFTLYWLLIKLENVIINRIHSFTSLRGAFNRMGFFWFANWLPANTDVFPRSSLLGDVSRGRILISESYRYSWKKIFLYGLATIHTQKVNWFTDIIFAPTYFNSNNCLFTGNSRLLALINHFLAHCRLPSKSLVFNFAASSSLSAFLVTKMRTLPAERNKKKTESQILNFYRVLV